MNSKIKNHDTKKIINQRLSIFDTNKSLEEISNEFIEKLNKDNKPEDHIKFIQFSAFNLFDVFNKPDNTKNEFLNKLDIKNIKHMNKKYISLKNELLNYEKQLIQEYEDNIEFITEEKDNYFKNQIKEKFSQKCYDLRKEQSLYTIKILYNFFKQNNIKPTEMF